MSVFARKMSPEIVEEDKKVRYLKLLVDLSLSMIYQGQISFEGSRDILIHVRRLAVSLFPDKGETFDIIYGPRFNRAMNEVFGFEDKDPSQGLS